MDARARYEAVVKREGFSCLGTWALANGFSRTLIYHCVDTWGWRDVRPVGGVSRQIMAALRALESEQGRQG